MTKNKSKFTDRNERIQKRHTNAAGIPFGSRVVDADGIYFRRELDGFHVEGAEALVVTPLDMAYPLKRLAEKPHGLYLDRAGRRRIDREGARAKYLFARAKNRRAEKMKRAAYVWAKTGTAPLGMAAEVNADGTLKSFRPLTPDELAAVGPQKPQKPAQTAPKVRGHVVGPDGVEAAL